MRVRFQCIIIIVDIVIVAISTLCLLNALVQRLARVLTFIFNSFYYSPVPAPQQTSTDTMERCDFLIYSY